MKTGRKIPFTCPVCGKVTEYPLEILAEGAIITCRFCALTLKLHGHMWEDVQREIRKRRGATHPDRGGAW